MNDTLQDTQFDAEGKSRGPFARVELIYAPDLQRNSALPAQTRETSHRLCSGGSAEVADPAGSLSSPSPVSRNPKPRSAPSRESSLDRHQRKCVVCCHPDCETIEELFLHWHSPATTARHYNVPVRSLFRHAHATGLYAARQGNLRAVLDRVLERAEEASVTADSVVRTVRAYTCLTPGNQWVEPPSRVIFSTAPHAALADPALLAPSSAPLAANHLPLASASPGTSHSPLATESLIDTPAIRK